MAKLSETFVDLDITVCGVTRDVEARVEYLYSRAFGPIYDGSGPVSPAEPENAEIQSVKIPAPNLLSHLYCEITHLLTDKQLDAISDYILEE